MYHGQFFGKIVHEIWTIEKKIILSVDRRPPWTIVRETYNTRLGNKPEVNQAHIQSQLFQRQKMIFYTDKLIYTQN
jgi:hypothetical protein